MSDLDALLARPGFRGGLIDTAPDVVGEMLPLLDDTVAITVAGPVAVNDSGKYSVPTVPGDPLVCTPGLVSLRLNVASLGSVVTTEAEQHIPPTLRIFDIHGSSSHTTYLTPASDRLAFEAMRTAPSTARETSPPIQTSNTPAFWAEADQLTQLDFILADGGSERRSGLVALGASVTGESILTSWLPGWSTCPTTNFPSRPSSPGTDACRSTVVTSTPQPCSGGR